MGSYRFKMNIKASVPGLDEVIKDVGAFDGKTRLRVENTLRNATGRVQRGAQRRVPKRTGLLRRSIRKSFSTSTMVGKVEAKQPHAHLLEFGVKKTVIKPKKKKALTVGAGYYGPIKLAKKAVIPERKPRPFMRPAFDEVAPTLAKEVAKEIER